MTAAVPAAALAAAALAGASLAGCGADEREANAPRDPAPLPAGPPVTKPTVVVSPRSGPPGTVFTFRGRGWRPNRPVETVHGVYCPPGATCILIGLSERFRADARGEFTFRFREGRSAAGLPPPAAAGSGLHTFEQWAGEPYRSDLIRVRARYKRVP